MKPAIVTPALSVWVEEARDLVRGIREAEQLAATLETRLSETRQAAQGRRIEMGLYLLKVKDSLPKRGTRENGWLSFLEAIEVDDSTAFRYMELARSPSTRSQEGELRSNATQVREGAFDDSDTPPPRDEDAPRETEGTTPVDEVEIDRDTWCTPQWITDAIGEWDLDPCANDRSHVQAKKYFDLDAKGEDGLVLASSVRKSARVFLNPPYSAVKPWIEAYGHTRFCFLLKVDPSTAWFELLLSKCELVLIPKRTRVQFEAPEGVPPEKSLANQFPHALFYARATDATDAIAALCYPGWFINRSA